MKKALISFVSVVVLLGMVGMASANSKDLPANNVWTWIEIFPSLGYSDVYDTTVPFEVGAFNAFENSEPTNLFTFFYSNGNVDEIFNGIAYNKVIKYPGTSGEYEGWNFKTEYTGGTFWFGSQSASVSATVYSDQQYNYTGGKIVLFGNSYPLDPNFDGFTMTGILTDAGVIMNGGGHTGTITTYIPTTAAPEPATLLLLGLGLAGLAGIRKKYKS